MTQNQVALAVGVWLVLMVICYSHSGWRNMRDCYAMWFTREYWTSYNTVAVSYTHLTLPTNREV